MEIGSLGHYTHHSLSALKAAAPLSKTRDRRHLLTNLAKTAISCSHTIFNAWHCPSWSMSSMQCISCLSFFCCCRITCHCFLLSSYILIFFIMVYVIYVMYFVFVFFFVVVLSPVIVFCYLHIFLSPTLPGK